MNVLSLFDGMSCGRIALSKMGILPTNYFASEIDKMQSSAQKQTGKTLHILVMLLKLVIKMGLFLQSSESMK